MNADRRGDGGGGTGRPPVHVIIPARLASTRFPRKVLADRTGRPLVQHVYERAALSRRAASVTVAVDDEEVRAALRPFATPTVMTRPDHANGSSRLAEASESLGVGDDEIVVNVQGDEPELDPAVIDAVADALASTPGDGRGAAQVATAATPIEDGAERTDPNVVKVVTDLSGMALYFSRSRVPFERDGGRGTGAQGGSPATVLKHIGIYAYRAAYLRRYVRLAPTPLEQAEMLEQLRVLEHGGRIVVVRVKAQSRGIDTPEQYDDFVRRFLSARS